MILISEYEKQIYNQTYGLCSNCEQPKTCWEWCKNCNSKRFEKDFNKWTSNNKLIDTIIQDAQLKARNKEEVIEWIPFYRLRNIQFLAQGGFSTVYKAIWLDGRIRSYWDNEKQQWERKVFKLNDEDYKNARNKSTKSPLRENEKTGFPIVLKCLNNSSNINEDFLNEWKNYLNILRSAKNEAVDSVQTYGITQDPKTSNYMIAMVHMELGSLRSNLMIKKYNPYDKYNNLFLIARSLSSLHKCNLVHGDFHSGNLLLQSHKYAYISDFGLCRPADKPTKSGEIYGILPYIAPEVLREKPYTKAADIYSFGIIMWELTSGYPAFNNVPHDFNLSLAICQGLRPEIVEGTELEYSDLMKKCWDSDPNKRPTSDELIKHYRYMRQKYLSNYERTPVPENEPINQNHSSSYTSRKIDYATKLNELLAQEELSAKIIISRRRKIRNDRSKSLGRSQTLNSQIK